VLLERQRLGSWSSAHGIAVKINTIVLPGINGEHASEVAREVASLGRGHMN